MATENTSPRRSGADWFGLAAFAVLLISSTAKAARPNQSAPLRRGEVFSVAIAFLLCVGISRRCAASQSTPIVIYMVTVSYYISCGVKFPSLFVTKL